MATRNASGQCLDQRCGGFDGPDKTTVARSASLMPMSQSTVPSDTWQGKRLPCSSPLSANRSAKQTVSSACIPSHHRSSATIQRREAPRMASMLEEMTDSHHETSARSGRPVERPVHGHAGMHDPMVVNVRQICVDRGTLRQVIVKPRRYHQRMI